MDQMTPAIGEAGQLLSMVCQPAEVGESVRIPDDIAFWGIDSGIRHSIGGGNYGSVRTGAFMGYRMIAEAADLKAKRFGRRCRNRRPGMERIFGKYLALRIRPRLC